MSATTFSTRTSLSSRFWYIVVMEKLETKKKDWYLSSHLSLPPSLSLSLCLFPSRATSLSLYCVCMYFVLVVNLLLPFHIFLTCPPSPLPGIWHCYWEFSSLRGNSDADVTLSQIGFQADFSIYLQLSQTWLVFSTWLSTNRQSFFLLNNGITHTHTLEGVYTKCGSCAGRVDLNDTECFCIPVLTRVF